MPRLSITPPEVKPYSLDEFFQKKYSVPAYQRNYSWTEVEVNLFMDDLIAFFDDPTEPFYLLGDAIVVNSPSNEFDFEIIDGQQRISTLMLLFSSIARRLQSANFDTDEVHTIRAIVAKSGKARLKMSGKASDSVLQYLNGTELEDLPSDTASQVSVKNALESIKIKLDERFGAPSDPNLLFDFFIDVQTAVFISRLRITSAEAAFEFFERVNDRGRPLSKTDLLKNRLLQQIKSDDEFDSASTSWSDAEKRLLPFDREGTMNYLLRIMLTADLGVKVKDSDLFIKWKPFVNSEAQCKTLVNRISRESKGLSEILSGNSPSGNSDPNCAGTNFMRFTQNISVKLAALEAPESVYMELSKRLEARALLSLFALERSQTYEGDSSKWSNLAKGLNANSSIADAKKVLELTKLTLDDLIGKAKVTVENLRVGKTAGQTNKIRLMLAIVNFELVGNKVIHHYGLSELLQTSKRTGANQHPGYDIEHIGASSTAQHLGERINSIGNLALLHSADNRSNGANETKFKVDSYGNSICYATKVLDATPENDPKVEADLASYRKTTVNDGVWNLTKVAQREAFYWKILENYFRRELG
jgi:hypothetical protein